MEMKNRCDKMVLYVLFDIWNDDIDYDRVNPDHPFDLEDTTLVSDFNLPATPGESEGGGSTISPLHESETWKESLHAELGKHNIT